MPEQWFANIQSQVLIRMARTRDEKPCLVINIIIISIRISIINMQLCGEVSGCTCGIGKNQDARQRVVRPSKVEHVTTIVSYLRERLTLIFMHEIQADKSSFVNITASYTSTFSSLFYRSIFFVNKCPQSLVMSHDILLKLSYSSPSSQPCQHNRAHKAIIFEAYIFVCVGVRALELLTQVLWL